jgi:nucleotide-binding universal stress UspA family protein
MVRNILIATDGSELADKAVIQGIALAKALGARVTGVTVTEPFHVITADVPMIEDTPDEYARHAAEKARAILSRVEQAAQNSGVGCDTVHVSDDDPYEGILKAAAQTGADMIAMASHGRRGIAGVLLGSQTHKVLTHGTIPVLVYR